MYALEKIKKIKDRNYELPPGMSIFKYAADTYRDEIIFLLRAFQVMREIAIEAMDSELTSRQTAMKLAEKDVDEEFEKRMLQ